MCQDSTKKYGRYYVMCLVVPIQTAASCHSLVREPLFHASMHENSAGHICCECAKAIEDKKRTGHAPPLSDCQPAFHSVGSGKKADISRRNTSPPIDRSEQSEHSGLTRLRGSWNKAVFAQAIATHSQFVRSSPTCARKTRADSEGHWTPTKYVKAERDHTTYKQEITHTRRCKPSSSVCANNGMPWKAGANG